MALMAEADLGVTKGKVQKLTDDLKALRKAHKQARRSPTISPDLRRSPPDLPRLAVSARPPCTRMARRGLQNGPPRARAAASSSPFP